LSNKDAAKSKQEGETLAMPGCAMEIAGSSDFAEEVGDQAQKDET
jgi:hypothetical protein